MQTALNIAVGFIWFEIIVVLIACYLLHKKVKLNK